MSGPMATGDRHMAIRDPAAANKRSRSEAESSSDNDNDNDSENERGRRRLVDGNTVAARENTQTRVDDLESVLDGEQTPIANDSEQDRHETDSSNGDSRPNVDIDNAIVESVEEKDSDSDFGSGTGYPSLLIKGSSSRIYCGYEPMTIAKVDYSSRSTLYVIRYGFAECPWYVLSKTVGSLDVGMTTDKLPNLANHFGRILDHPREPYQERITNGDIKGPVAVVFATDDTLEQDPEDVAELLNPANFKKNKKGNPVSPKVYTLLQFNRDVNMMLLPSWPKTRAKSQYNWEIASEWKKLQSNSDKASQDLYECARTQALVFRDYIQRHDKRQVGLEGGVPTPAQRLKSESVDRVLTPRPQFRAKKATPGDEGYKSQSPQAGTNDTDDDYDGQLTKEEVKELLEPGFRMKNGIPIDQVFNKKQARRFDVYFRGLEKSGYVAQEMSGAPVAS